MRQILLSILAGLSTLLPTNIATAEPKITLVTATSAQPLHITASGLSSEHLAKLAKLESDDERWSQALALYVAEDAGIAARDAGLPAMLGSYTVTGSSLRFTPRYPLRPGTKYRAVLHPAGNAGTNAAVVESLIDVAAIIPAKVTSVAAVYPSADTLPENLLKFYLHFTAPMSRGEAYEHLRLLKENGEPVDLPFLEIGEELWSHDGRRLLLLFDPGRVKRGVKPREDIGPALVAGQKFTLAITKGWRDAAGQPLAADFQKQFTVTEPIQTAIDASAWQIIPPAASSRNSLIVKFDRALDQALLEHTLTVMNKNSDSLSGRVTISHHERQWEFAPAGAWTAGDYRLLVDTTLEDLAGNRIGLPFEVDQLRPIERRVRTETIEFPFRISPAKNASPRP